MLALDAPSFICRVDVGSIDKPNLSWVEVRPPQYQVCVGNVTHLGGNHYSDGKITDGTTIKVSQAEWDAAQKCVQLVKEQSELTRRQLIADLSKSIAKLMETTNSWANGEDRGGRSHPLSNNDDSDRRSPVVLKVDKSVKKGGETSTMSQMIVPKVALVSAMTSTMNKVASDRLVAATDQIAFLRCIICRSWGS
jgi:hypothetical protein